MVQISEATINESLAKRMEESKYKTPAVVCINVKKLHYPNCFIPDGRQILLEWCVKQEWWDMFIYKLYWTDKGKITDFELFNRLFVPSTRFTREVYLYLNSIDPTIPKTHKVSVTNAR